MALNSTPSIACIGIIGRHDNPLHTTIFPPHDPSDPTLEFSYLLNSSLDVFTLRARNATLTSDLGLLHAVSERLSTYGFLTATGIKFIIVVDMMGRPAPVEEGSEKEKRRFPPVVGVRDADLKPAFKAIQTAYIQLLLNPFYTPDERTPLQMANYGGKSGEIMSKKFADEMQRIGKAWYPGVAAI